MPLTLPPARITPAIRRAFQVCALLILFATPLQLANPTPAAASRIPFPTYVYAIANGAYTYDLIINKAGDEKRLSRIGVSGVGFTDISVQLAPGAERVAVRLNGNAAGGSSLRVVEISSSKSVTTTLRTGSGEGVGSFAWSPDGKTLAYTLAAPQKVDADSGVGTVWIVNYDGKWPRKISGKGNDRLVGWSPDGSGVYVQRGSSSGNTVVNSLYYFHLNGESRQVLVGTTATNYRRFAISRSPIPDAAYGTARISALAINSRTASAVTTPTLVLGDGSTTYKLMQGDSEDYAALNWSPDGYHVLASGGSSGKSWIVDANTGQRWAVAAQTNNLTPIAWTSDSRYALLAPANGPATTLMTLDTSSGKLYASRSVGKAAIADAPVKSLTIPYINQVWDTNKKVSGVWACGPTSVAMILAAYGRLDPWPLASGSTRSSSVIQADSADEDGSLYSQYITDAFSFHGRSFTSTSKDRDGHKLAGLYGSIVGSDALAHWEKMIDVLEFYDLDTNYLPVTWAAITASLDKGFPVIIGTNLTSDGHILVAKGYTKNGYLIVHDPYGNKWGPQGYGGPDGKNVAYPWRKLTAKMALQVKGTIWTPTPTPTPTEVATSTATPTVTATPVYSDFSEAP